MQRQALTPSQVGALIGVTGKTIRLEIAAGELPAFRTRKGHWRILIIEADRYIARMTGKTKPTQQVSAAL